ncbi:Cyclin P/U [Corchorus capsularis]|uniref:Cyclin P/U n=1 Tax=Corchorus capsularis TaxID=210143 RepID=A0A1R3I579_COCAP|nr:Cyclin P/U [Corchorus capsularis]
MGSLAIDTGDVDLDIYLTLGLKGLGKGAVGTPRILSILASLLEKSVEKNDMNSETVDVKDSVAIFHGLRAPTISIQQYIDRIFKYGGCSPSCFVIAYIYVDRFVQQTNVHLTSLNVHRLLITSVMVAAKFIDDACKKNLQKGFKLKGLSELAELKRVGRAKVITHVLPQLQDDDLLSIRLYQSHGDA